MPKRIERAIRVEMKKKGIKANSERGRAYLYGTLRKTGWKPEREKK